MKLCLRDFEIFPAHWDSEFGSDSLKPNFESVVAVKGGRVALDIQKSDKEYYCQGRMTAAARLECARCLEPFDTELVSELDFIVCGRDHYETLKSEAVDSEDYVFIESSDLTADITASLEQALILAVSMKPLCNEDCRGICPVCGENLNQANCDCNREKTDPRWDALKDLTADNN